MTDTTTPGDFRRRVLAGETLIGAWASLDAPASAEVMGHAGLDWIVVDLEHGAATEASLLAHLYAIDASGIAAISSAASRAIGDSIWMMPRMSWFRAATPA